MPEAEMTITRILPYIVAGNLRLVVADGRHEGNNADRVKGTSALQTVQPEAVGHPDDLVGWRPEQLWLSNGCWTCSVQQAMADAVKAAISAMLSKRVGVVLQYELLQVLRYRRREVAWLRLAARVLRGPTSTATSQDRNLAASALLVAAVRHKDLLASVEFSAEVTEHAALLEVDQVPGAVALPPNMATVSEIANHMRSRAREVTALRATWSDIDAASSCLERAMSEDPLRGLSELTPLAGG